MTSRSRFPDRLKSLRFVFFGESIASDWGNPAATTMRAILRALVRLGHHALYLEERGNRPTVDLLHARGPAALLAFTTRYPDIYYRTYALPSGVERAVWLGRELAVADAVVVNEDAPLGVVGAVAQASATHLIKVALLGHAGSPSFPADLVLSPVGIGDVPHLGPAIDPDANHVASERKGVLVVAYDNTLLAAEVAATLAPLAPILLAPGGVESAGFTAVPEVELPLRYEKARLAIVVEPGSHPLAAARLLLPLASGCQVCVAGRMPSSFRPSSAVARSVMVESIVDQVTALLGFVPAEAAAVPPEFDATLHAARLVNQVEATRIARRAASA